MTEDQLHELWEQAEIPESVSVPEQVNYRQQTMSHLSVFKKTIITEISLGVIVFLIAMFMPLQLVTKLFVVFISLGGLGLSVHGFLKMKRIVHTDSTHLFLTNVIETLRAFSIQFLVFSSIIMIGAIFFFVQANQFLADGNIFFSILMGLVVELLLYAYYRIFYRRNIIRLEKLKVNLESDTNK